MQEHQEKYSSKPDYSEGILHVGDGTEGYLFEDWTSYLAGMKKEGVWATELEIDALAYMLRTPFVVFSKEYPKPRVYNTDASEKNPVFLHHVNQNHFEACVPFKGLEPRDIYEVIKIRGYN